MIPGIVAGRAVPQRIDPHYANVVSLLNFIGPNNATTTTDNKGLPWSFSGNAKIDTSQSANGTSSLLLDGSGDFISTPDTAVMRTDVSIFTMDGYARRGTSKLQALCSKRNSSSDEFTLYVLANNTIQFTAYNSSSPAINLVSTGTVAAGAFFHWEVGRSGTVWYLFLNGVLEASGTQASAPTTASSAFNIGRETFNTGRDFNGWVGAFRRTNGVVRHTASFTPPSAPFPAA